MALCLHSSRFCFGGGGNRFAICAVFSCKDCGVGEPLGSGLTLPISSIFTGRGGGLSSGLRLPISSIFTGREGGFSSGLRLRHRGRDDESHHCGAVATPLSLPLCRYWSYALMPAELSLYLVWVNNVCLYPVPMCISPPIFSSTMRGWLMIEERGEAGFPYSSFHFMNHRSLNVMPRLSLNAFSRISPSAERCTHCAEIFTIERLFHPLVIGRPKPKDADISLCPSRPLIFVYGVE